MTCIGLVNERRGSDPNVSSPHIYEALWTSDLGIGRLEAGLKTFVFVPAFPLSSKTNIVQIPIRQ